MSCINIIQIPKELTYVKKYKTDEIDGLLDDMMYDNEDHFWRTTGEDPWIFCDSYSEAPEDDIEPTGKFKIKENMPTLQIVHGRLFKEKATLFIDENENAFIDVNFFG